MSSAHGKVHPQDKQEAAEAWQNAQQTVNLRPNTAESVKEAKTGKSIIPNALIRFAKRGSLDDVKTFDYTTEKDVNVTNYAAVHEVSEGIAAESTTGAHPFSVEINQAIDEALQRPPTIAVSGIHTPIDLGSLPPSPLPRPVLAGDHEAKIKVSRENTQKELPLPQTGASSTTSGPMHSSDQATPQSLVPLPRVGPVSERQEQLKAQGTTITLVDQLTSMTSASQQIESAIPPQALRPQQVAVATSMGSVNNSKDSEFTAERDIVALNTSGTHLFNETTNYLRAQLHPVNETPFSASQGQLVPVDTPYQATANADAEIFSEQQVAKMRVVNFAPGKVVPDYYNAKQLVADERSFIPAELAKTQLSRVVSDMEQMKQHHIQVLADVETAFRILDSTLR